MRTNVSEYPSFCMCFDIAEESFTPVGQGGGVMRTDVFQMIETHIGMIADILCDYINGR